jgi:Uma2 family endonuclease
VQEYWIVNPVRETVLVYRLEGDGVYGKPEEFRRGETLDCSAVAVISVELDLIFQ